MYEIVFIKANVYEPLICLTLKKHTIIMPKSKQQ